MHSMWSECHYSAACAKPCRAPGKGWQAVRKRRTSVISLFIVYLSARRSRVKRAGDGQDHAFTGTTSPIPARRRGSGVPEQSLIIPSPMPHRARAPPSLERSTRNNPGTGIMLLIPTSELPTHVRTATTCRRRELRGPAGSVLGHRSGRMTTHYSAAELTKLIEAANRVCEREGNKPELVVLRRLSVS